MDELKIDNVNQLKWLLAVVACGLLFVYGFARKRQALAAFASSAVMATIAPAISFPRQYAKAVLRLLAMTAIVLAMIGPRWGTYYEDAIQKRLDLMICLDVSRSMLAEDAGMSRLDRAKDDIKRLLDRLGGGSIGLIAFAGKADLVCPLTDDYEFYRMTLDDVGVHSAAMGGTNLAEAIKAAVKGFSGSANKQRVIIVMTDGEDTLGGKPEEDAKKARELGMQVYTIGIGDSQRGSLIPVSKDGGKSYVVFDDQQVWSKMNPDQLMAVAMAGGGEYHPSGQVGANQRTLDWLYTDKLASREERTTKEKRIARQYAQFAWPASAALVLLVMESLVRERREVGA